jgi:hypothetical protein
MKWMLVAVGLSACGQTDTCKSYVECQQAVDSTVDITDYKVDGACWAQPAVARTCDAQCTSALTAIQSTPNPPASCTAPPE